MSESKIIEIPLPPGFEGYEALRIVRLSNDETAVLSKPQVFAPAKWGVVLGCAIKGVVDSMFEDGAIEHADGSPATREEVTKVIVSTLLEELDTATPVTSVALNGRTTPPASVH